MLFLEKELSPCAFGLAQAVFFMKTIFCHPTDNIQGKKYFGGKENDSNNL
ncbi:hypothetical protein GGQ92_002487 [Gracilibacillus halotolerans]|uniref:Uncharacterized protein n=1 Tax=Gracilibacillus halotolerans TaxID=74386 RepID=A0A841RPX6_9BACI|nr:hypothetical protein [Gracilibacillus halotolerans]